MYYRVALEDKGAYDKTRLITKLEDGNYVIPVSIQLRSSSYHQVEEVICTSELSALFEGCQLVNLQQGHSVRQRHHRLTDIESLVIAMRETTKELDHIDKKSLRDFMDKLLSIKIYRHSDLIVLSNLTHPLWEVIRGELPSLWPTIATALHCNRIALLSKISPDGYRTPVTELVLGETGWVEHTDNRVKYIFDVTCSMFSQGNISEKIRMSSLRCNGETIIDLYAGNGSYMKTCIQLTLKLCCCYYDAFFLLRYWVLYITTVGACWCYLCPCL